MFPVLMVLPVPRGLLFLVRVPSPLRVLQRLHRMVRLSGWSDPPCECGVMWSTSAEAACRGPSQTSFTLQLGQCSSPSRRARVMTLLRTFFHCVVAVRGVIACVPLLLAVCPAVTL